MHRQHNLPEDTQPSGRRLPRHPPTTAPSSEMRRVRRADGPPEQQSGRSTRGADRRDGCGGRQESVGEPGSTGPATATTAFQSVNHKLLLFKLETSYHISGMALDWFSSYLSEREQRVVVNGKTSEWRTVTSGVPEGALLALLLFALYINDLPMAVT